MGAGTVTRGEELAAVAEAGAVFAISPGLTGELLDAANQGPIPLIPGISTVSELMTGMALGYTHFKFFPAEAAGGVKMLKAIAGPFPQITFCPTGGITLANYRDYLALECCLRRRLVGRSAGGDGPGGLGRGLPLSPGKRSRNQDAEQSVDSVPCCTRYQAGIGR